MNRLRWVDRKTGRVEDVEFYFDEDLSMSHVTESLEALSRIIPERPARWEIRPGR